MGHVGFATSLTPVWRLLPERQTIEIKLCHEPGESIPADPEASIDWLFERWRRLDSWVDERRRARTQGDPAGA